MSIDFYGRYQASAVLGDGGIYSSIEDLANDRNRTLSIGDTETPASAGDVAVVGAVAQILAGNAHT